MYWKKHSSWPDLSSDVLHLQFEEELTDLCSRENCDTNLDPDPEWWPKW
jgi:hypothetical protein